MVGKEKKKKLLLLLFGLIKRKEKNCDYVKEPILPLKSTTEWHRSAMMGHGGGACIWETATTTTGIVMVAMAWALGSTIPVERYRYEEREPQQRWHVRCIAEEVRSALFIASYTSILDYATHLIDYVSCVNQLSM